MQKIMRIVVNRPIVYTLVFILSGFSVQVLADSYSWDGELLDFTVTDSTIDATLDDVGTYSADEDSEEIKPDNGGGGGGDNTGVVIAAVLVVGALVALGAWWYMDYHSKHAALNDGEIEAPLAENTSLVLSPKVLDQLAWEEEPGAESRMEDLTAAELSLRVKF